MVNMLGLRCYGSGSDMDIRDKGSIPRAGPVMSSILAASTVRLCCARWAEFNRSKGIKPISRNAAVAASV